MPFPNRSELLSLVHAAFGPGAGIAACHDLAGDASTRRYLRLELDGSTAPPTAVVMVLADRAVSVSSDELASLPSDLDELPYVNVYRFVEHIGTPVPRLFTDASDHGLLLLEDVGDTTLWSLVENASEDEVRQWYERAIAELVRFQVVGTRERDEACIAFHQSFDRRLFRWELDHFLEWGLLAHRAEPLPADDAEVLERSFDAIAGELDALPRVLNHRDYHSWNLHVRDGRVRIIDFQDALLAPVPYDLATLLGDRDTPQVVRPSLEERLLSSYRELWHAAGGEPLDARDFRRAYDLCSLQKALKVVGRFHYLDRVKGKPGYLRFLPSTLRQVRRVAARLADLAPLHEVLDRLLPEDG